MDSPIDRIKQLVDALPAGLQAHIYRARKIALELAAQHGVDPERAGLGILAHDIARAMTGAGLVRRAIELGLQIGPVERQMPVLLYGPVGAEILRVEESMDDPPIHNAVYWHTTGHASLDTLGKVVFLADKLDPQKITRYPYQPQLHRLAMEDLDWAMLEFLTREMVSLTTQAQLVHPAMVDARNALLLAASTRRPSVEE